MRLDRGILVSGFIATFSLLLFFCFSPMGALAQTAVAGKDGGAFAVEVSPADGSYSIRSEGISGRVLQANVAAKVDEHWLHAADYPKHEIAESDAIDALGAAHQFVITHTGLANEPDLVCTLKVRPGSSAADIEVQVVNHQSKSFTVQAIRPFEVFGNPIVNLGGPEISDRVLSDSFSEDRPEMHIQDLIENPPVDMQRAVGVQLIYNRVSGRSLFIGALSADRFLTILRLHLDPQSKDSAIRGYEAESTGMTEMLKENSLEDSPPADQVELSLPLDPGQSLASEALRVGVSSDYHAQLESYGRVIRTLHHPRHPQVTPMGWWSWTAYYFGLNQGTALTNAQWLSENLKKFGYDFFHIDEGYQYARGEYTTPDAGLFPDGMDALEQKIRGLGLIPGIWTAPFEVAERSWVYTHHKDWLVHNLRGEPIHLGKVTDNFDQLYAIDTTNPGAQEYLRETYRTLVNSWSIHYIKLDFMEDSGPEGVRYRPNTTALEAQRIGLQVIRDAVGENVLLDKDGSPMLTPVGLVDTGRISVDTGHSFDATSESAPGVAARYYMNRNYFIADPDAFGVSRQTVSDHSWHNSQNPLTLDQAKASIALAAVAGGMYEIGDDLPTLGRDADRLALIENQDLINMIRLGRSSRPMDLMNFKPEDVQPSIFLLREDRRQSILTVFNWTTQSHQHKFTFAKLGFDGKGPYRVEDVFASEKPLSVSVDGSFEVPQGPQSARVLKIIDSSIAPAAPSMEVKIPNSAAAGVSVTMSAQAAAEGVPVVSYKWEMGDGVTLEGPSITHAYTDAGDYTVKIVAQGIDGLSASKTIHFTVTGSVDTRFFPDRKIRLQ